MVVHNLLRAQITGKGIKSIHQLPANILQRQDASHHYIPSQLHRLSVQTSRRDISGVKRTLRRLLVLTFPQGVGLPHGFAAQQEELSAWLNPSRAVQCRDAFISFGGLEVVRNVISEFRSTVMAGGARRDSAVFWDCVLILNCGLALCKEMCFHSSLVSGRLAEEDGFVAQLFELCRENATLSPHPPKKFCHHSRPESHVQHSSSSSDLADFESFTDTPSQQHLPPHMLMLPEESSTFDNAVGLLEELLAARRTSFDLKQVPHLEKLIASLDEPKLALFCGVLALVAFDPEERERDPAETNLAMARQDTAAAASSSSDSVDDTAAESTMRKAAWISKMRHNDQRFNKRIVDDNHRCILDIDNLAPRLIALLVHPDHVQVFHHHMHSPNDEHIVPPPFFQLQQLAAMQNFTPAQRQQMFEYIRSQIHGSEHVVDALEQIFHLTSPMGFEAGQVSEDSTDPVPEMMDLSTNEFESHTNQYTDTENMHEQAGAALQNTVEPRENSPSATTSSSAATNDRMEQLEAWRRSNSQATLKSFSAGTHKVEVLFVMSCLMASQHRNSAQDGLARLCLVPTLTRLFDALEWQDNHDDIQPHGENCDCNPEAALKLQFLRLLHNFCNRASDNNANKRLLVSPKELSSLGLHRDLQWLREEQLSANGDGYKEDLDKGLMTRLVDTLLNLPDNSPYRFWMALGIESFLRGADPAHQLFIARKGVFTYLVDNIVCHHRKKKAHTQAHRQQGLSGNCPHSERSKTMEGTLQTHFDLLGEMLKFNAESFRIFNRQVSADQWILLRHVVTDNLVDSNVFVRSIVLSLERFDRDGSYPLHDRAQCKLTEFVTQHQMTLLGDLMICVSVDELTPENICCLNTALTFFLLAATPQKASQYIDSLKCNIKYGRSALQNFQHLLLFWRRYYSVCGNDSKSLEFSSAIPFARWQEIVSMLLGLSKRAASDDHSSNHVSLPSLHQPRLS